MVLVPNGLPTTFANWKQQMLIATDESGIHDVTLAPTEVWRIIRDRFYSDDNVVVQCASKSRF